MSSTNQVHTINQSSESAIQNASSISASQFLDLYSGLREERIRRSRKSWMLAIGLVAIAATAGFVVL